VPAIQTIGLPVLDRLSMCDVVSAIMPNNFSSLAVLKFKLVSVIKIDAALSADKNHISA